jgi:hypothetical protein
VLPMTMIAFAAKTDGGAIFGQLGSDITLASCVFTENVASVGSLPH